MIFSSSLPSKAFWCIGLIIGLLVCPIKAQEYRQEELLYGRLRGDQVQYLLKPRLDAALANVVQSREHGLSGEDLSFPGKAKTLSHAARKMDLYVADYMPFNTERGRDEVVNATTIFRLENGQTCEYVTRVDRGEKCFTNIKLMNSCCSEDGAFGSERGSLDVEEELESLCKKGFETLKPMPSPSVLDGEYTGAQMERSLSLRFKGGKLVKAGLTVGEIARYQLATYYPLCDGVISLILRADDSPRGRTSIVILEKKTSQPHWFSLRKSSQRRESADRLCREEHVKRYLDDLHLHMWDRSLGEEFSLKPEF